MHVYSIVNYCRNIKLAESISFSLLESLHSSKNQRLSKYTCNMRIIVHTSNRPRASSTPLGEKLAKALGAVRLVVARRESLSRQGVVAVAAGKAVSVPRLVLVCHTSASDNLQQRILSLLDKCSTVISQIYSIEMVFMVPRRDLSRYSQ